MKKNKFHTFIIFKLGRLNLFHLFLFDMQVDYTEVKVKKKTWKMWFFFVFWKDVFIDKFLYSFTQPSTIRRNGKSTVFKHIILFIPNHWFIQNYVIRMNVWCVLSVVLIEWITVFVILNNYQIDHSYKGMKDHIMLVLPPSLTYDAFFSSLPSTNPPF